MFELVFDYGEVSVAVADSIRELQQRVHRMEGATLTRVLPVLETLAPLVSLRTGSVVTVDALGLVLALLAGPSRAGEWSAVVGLPDLGWEAAEQYGVDLSRTIAVPDPGEHWLTVTAGLVDVASVVVVRPTGSVSEHQAARIASRLRQRDAALVCYGAWPRASQRLNLDAPRWHGLGLGHGYLSGREVTVTARSGSAPPRSLQLLLPHDRVGVAAAPVTPPVLTAVPAG